MKTRFLRSWKLVIILTALPLAEGSLSGPGFTATAQETAPPTDVVAPVPNAPPSPTAVAPAQPTVKLSPGAAEIAKLAQAGLGEDVMLAYIGNVNSTFNLGSDQIVYLNDLGVSGTVVKAMIQSDADYNAAAKAWAAANQPPVPPAVVPPVPDASTYPGPSDDSSAAVDAGDTTDYVDPGDYTSTDDTDYFYNSLAPYGSWIHVTGAGMCWQPTVCFGNRGWQPYFDRGRWVYTDCGWYWQSDYSWGWAAFHYGRWFNARNRGWVWKPDHVRGPAWVSWRQSGEYCGWAPLPPSAHFVAGTGFSYRGHAVPASYDFGLRPGQFTFIPVSRLTDYSPYRYAASASQAAALYRQTVAINRFAVEHNHVVNRGIDPREVAEASGIQVRMAEIHETPVNPNAGVVSDRMAKQGDSLMILRPQLSAPRAVSRPRQLLAPPARNSGATKSSMNIPAPARVTPYPAGSLVLSGPRAGNTSQSSTPRILPNLDFSHQPARSGTGYYYASAAPVAAYESPQYYYPVNHEMSPPPAPETFNVNRRDFAYPHQQMTPQSGAYPSQIVIPSHYTVASRLQGGSAYTVYGSTTSEGTSEYRSSESRNYESADRHSVAQESNGGARAEHYSEHSLPTGGPRSYSTSYSSPSHFSSSSSSSSSGHR